MERPIAEVTVIRGRPVVNHRQPQRGVRAKLIDELAVGEIRHFEARTSVERASIRGSAYTVGHQSRKEFTTLWDRDTVVTVRRLA